GVRDGEGGRGALWLDALRGQVGDEGRGVGALLAGREDVGLDVAGAAGFDGGAVEVVEGAKARLAVGGGRLAGSHRRDEVVPERLAQGKCGLVLAADRRPLDGRLLEGHPDGAVEAGPAFAVTGIECVEALAEVIVDP